MVDMNYMTTEKRVRIVAALVEGMSIRATCRMTGAAKGTVIRLGRELGEACHDYQSDVLRNLPCKRVQCDEIWSFVQAKAKNADPAKKNLGLAGDIWTWTAICADTKLVPTWHVGSRGRRDAEVFMLDLAARMSGRIQLTTDGHAAYLDAVEGAFGCDVDYAQLVKIYGAPTGSNDERRYSPAECTGIEKRVVMGSPEAKHISTSYVERQNLTMRMHMRRFTRLTNGFSKKAENHAASVALHFMYYNFCKVHQTLRVTPAMEAGVADHPWTLEEVVQLLVDREQAIEAEQGPRRTRSTK